jgi:hypothetical protein
MSLRAKLTSKYTLSCTAMQIQKNRKVHKIQHKNPFPCVPLSFRSTSIQQHKVSQSRGFRLYARWEQGTESITASTLGHGKPIELKENTFVFPDIRCIATL